MAIYVVKRLGVCRTSEAGNFVKNKTLSKPTLWKLLKQVHKNERGAVSIETVLIVAAIALPILIFIIKFGWPRIKAFFDRGMDDLEEGASDSAAEGF